MAKKKILLIDYDQSALTSLEGILTGEGYEVVTAGDGQAGWDKFNKEAPDLVLMEAMLPKVHGFELCQRITSERNPQTTVFMMTGVYKDRVYRTEALRTYGAAEYFEKPLKMAELLASLESVLGKPEPKPAAAPAPAKPHREARPEPAMVEARRSEKPKPARDEFALPADLDMLSREIPKARKPAPAHHEAPPETRLDSLADEILRTAVPGPAPHRAVSEKPRDHNGNGNKTADIDQFLKSALAGFDLNQEKVKVPKTAPLPHPPQAGTKQRPTPPASAAVDERASEKPKPAPPPQAAYSQSAPKVPAGTLIPGDPGSDASPFFTPEKAKPAKARDAAPAPVPPRPVERPKVQPPPPQLRKTEVRAEEKVSTTEMFTDLIEAKAKKGFPPIVAAGAVVAVLAVAGFFILRPKKPAAPVAAAVQPAQTAVQPSVPETKVEEPPAAAPVTAPVTAPAPKPKAPAPKPRVETQTRVAAVGPSSEDAILLPTQTATVPGRAVNPPAAPGNKPADAADSPGATATQADSPPVKPEANPIQPAAAETGAAADPGVAPVAPPPAPVKEGDLVDLATVEQQPRTLKAVDPIYPPAAQRLGVEGSITVNALIDETGTVIDTGILKGIKDDRGLGKAAENAVSKWKFQPARKGGVNVKVWKSFIIVFKNSAKMIK